MEDFEKSLKISNNFYKLGFKRINPEIDIINLSGNKTEIKISYDVTKNLHISATLTNVENCNGKKIQNTVNITRFKKYFSVKKCRIYHCEKKLMAIRVYFWNDTCYNVKKN